MYKLSHFVWSCYWPYHCTPLKFISYQVYTPIAGNFRGFRGWRFDHEYFTHEWSDFAYLYLQCKLQPRNVSILLNHEYFVPRKLPAIRYRPCTKLIMLILPIIRLLYGLLILTLVFTSLYQWELYCNITQVSINFLRNFKTIIIFWHRKLSKNKMGQLLALLMLFRLSAIIPTFAYIY